MADKSVGELIAAQSVTPTDLFVLEQNGTAKKLTGQVLENWLVSFADGHGGIQSIAKVSTSGLVDTYRITLADTTPFDFLVTNGRDVRSITKTGTSGLVDTYTIRYNDSTSDTFTVTNGAKGDKGDNAYMWIKYASQEPTDSSHSFGDVPDTWIGVYFGNLSSAPTDWQQYSWYKWKGDKGETGDPATLTTAIVTYQVGDSGSIIPSGAWGSSIPVVSQGKYLWTKTEVRFNTGDPIVSYSVARMGIDGTGSVSSVAGVSPDATGNVTLTAADVGALAVSGGDMEGAINMNGQPISGLNYPTEETQAARKGYVDAVVRAAAPRNLLDNSDFRNPINQRGASRYSGNVYGIDRWKGDGNTAELTIKDSGIVVNGDHLAQKLPESLSYIGKTLTLAVCDSTGFISAVSCEIPSTSTSKWLAEKTENIDFGIYYQNDGNLYICIKNVNSEISIVWAALYEGEYTIDTLPEYQPKGYGAELAECQRYYRRYGGSVYTAFGNATARNSTTLTMFFDLGNIRTNPTFGFSGSLKAYGDKNIGGLTMATDTFSNGIKRVNINGDGFTTGYSYIVAAETDAIIEFSADL